MSQSSDRPRSHAEEIMNARMAIASDEIRLVPLEGNIGYRVERREPLEEASYKIQQATADLYLLIGLAKDNEAITRVWTRIQELESLIGACANAAGAKADAL